MALAITAVDSGALDTDGTSFATNSVTPTANALQLLAVARRPASGGIPSLTVTGCGLTWVAVRTAGRITLFRALGPSPTTGALTITASATAICLVYSWVEVTGVDASGANGAGAIVQNNGVSAGGTSTSIATTLAARSAIVNYLYECSTIRVNGAITHPTSWTELHDLGTATDTTRCESAWYNADDLAPQVTFGASDQRGIIAVEIKAAPLTLALSPATAAWSARTLTLAGAAKALALSPAAAAWSARTLAPAPAGVSLALSPAAAAWSAGVVNGALAITVALSPAAAAWSPSALTITPSAGTLALSPATAAWSAATVTATPAGVSAALTPASAAWSAETVIVPIGVELTPAEAQWSAEILTAVPAGLALTLIPAEAAWSAGTLAPAGAPLTVALTPASSSWSATALSVSPAPGTLVLSPATSTWSSSPLGPTSAPVTLELTPAAAAWSASAAAPTGAPLTVALAPAASSWSALTVAIAPAGIALALAPAASSWSAETVDAVIAFVVSLAPAVAEWDAAPLELRFTVTLVAASVQWSAGELGVTVAPRKRHPRRFRPKDVSSDHSGYHLWPRGARFGP